jgi:surface polysaccharide O-acyltransferase-like enzyme
MFLKELCLDYTQLINMLILQSIIMNISKNQRNSNLELLRILSMLFIVSCHFTAGGFEDYNLVISNLNNYIIYFLDLFGKVGVDVFILISAYFMINSKFTLKKLLVLGGEVYFYSLILFLITVLLVPTVSISITSVLKTVLPISHGYWFINCYIVLMLFSPFLNKFIKELSKNTLLKLLLLLIIIWSIYPTFTGASLMYGDSFGYGYMAWFIVLYFIGAFIRLHLDIKQLNSKKLFAILIASIALLYLGSVIIGQLGILFNIGSLTNGETTVRIAYQFFTRENRFFVLVMSIALVLIFLKRKEFSNKYINYIAGSVFGVYLIHNNTFVHEYLWKSLIPVSSYYYSPNFWIVAIISIVAVYLVCTGIDIIRRETVEKLWIKFVDNKLIGIINRCYIKGITCCTKVLTRLLS